MDKKIGKIQINKTTISIFLIFTLFFLYLIYQNMQVFIYFDDYGYAGLNYGGHIQEAKGQSYTFLQGIEFLRQHYMNWGGRILYFGIEILLFRFGLNTMRIGQAIVVVGIAYMIYKFVSKKYPSAKVFIAMASCLVYGLFTNDVAGEGLYWFTASVLYVFPILPMMILIYYSFDILRELILNNKVNRWKYFLTFIMAFMVGFSHEQIAFGALIFCISMIIYSFIKTKKIKITYICNFTAALVGFIILYIAPGNAERQKSDQFYQLGLFDKISTATENILKDAVVKGNWVLLAVLLFLSSYALYCLSKRFKKTKYINLLLSIYTIGMCIYVTVTRGQFLTQELKIRLRYPILLTLTLIIVIYSLSMYLIFVKKAIEELIILITAAFVLAPVFYSSYWVQRMIIPFMYILFPIFVYMFCDIFNFTKSTKFKFNIWQPVCFVLGLWCILNASKIAYGYSLNSEVHTYNDKLLRETAEVGQASGDVILKENVNDHYTALMPYMIGEHKDMDNKIKKYYGIPESVNFIWQEK